MLNFEIYDRMIAAMPVSRPSDCSQGRGSVGCAFEIEWARTFLMLRLLFMLFSGQLCSPQGVDRYYNGRYCTL